MKLNVADMSLSRLRGNGLSSQQKKVLMISGIVIGAAALLTYPAILLYRSLKNKKGNLNDGEETVTKSFAPSYRGSHKPHHRKADSNGHMKQANA